jgi:hypothetical protein
MLFDLLAVSKGRDRQQQHSRTNDGENHWKHFFVE